MFTWAIITISALPYSLPTAPVGASHVRHHIMLLTLPQNALSSANPLTHLTNILHPPDPPLTFVSPDPQTKRKQTPECFHAKDVLFRWLFCKSRRPRSTGIMYSWQDTGSWLHLHLQRRREDCSGSSQTPVLCTIPSSAAAKSKCTWESL